MSSMLHNSYLGPATSHWPLTWRIIARAVCLVGTSLLVSCVDGDDYIEENPLELSLRSDLANATERVNALMHQYYEAGFRIFCLLPNNEFKGSSLIKIDGFEMHSIVSGREIETFPLENYYRMYWINSQGDAIIWNLNDRRYRISVPNSKENYFKCFEDKAPEIRISASEDLISISIDSDIYE